MKLFIKDGNKSRAETSSVFYRMQSTARLSLHHKDTAWVWLLEQMKPEMRMETGIFCLRT
jgi:hypothetical protein